MAVMATVAKGYDLDYPGARWARPTRGRGVTIWRPRKRGSLTGQAERETRLCVGITQRG